jgi:hypothetical protein
MARPCMCERPGCRLCWLYHNDPRYQAIWAQMTPQHFHPPVPNVRPNGYRTQRCIYLGIAVHGQEAPETVREWRHCEKGHGIVCPCGACKSCSDYQADDVTLDAENAHVSTDSSGR